MASQDFLDLPLTLREGHFRRCSLGESITASIGLILNTRAGYIDFLSDYGCPIWEHEFSDLFTANRADIRGKLRVTLDRLEPRLNNASLDFEPVRGSRHTSLGVHVRIVGNYIEDGEERKFRATYLLG